MKKILDPNEVLRMTISAGGCSGFQYGFEVSGEKNSKKREKKRNSQERERERERRKEVHKREEMMRKSERGGGEGESYSRCEREGLPS